MANTTAVSAAVLLGQDDKTSANIISLFEGDETFLAFAQGEGEGILKRDTEDGEKLAKGIKISVSNGVLPGDLVPAPYTQVDVLGKTADAVAEEILAAVGGAAQTGCVIVLVGLSGTGKGTTVSKLKEKIPGATTWSNGNVFRSLTLLAATFCEQEGKAEFDASVLTPENIAKWMGMLTFDQFDGKFDIKISGMGLEYYVSEVANTELKSHKVSKNIPTVAEVTQGEVVKFAAGALGAMSAAGQTVLLEGREQTVDYIPSPHRFCLVMSDASVLGKRRAAQRIGGATVSEVTKDTSDDVVTASLRSTLKRLASE